MANVTRRWLVSGRVQGVGYRFFVQKKASPLGLTGYVRNLEDGRVEVYAHGDEARLQDLGNALQNGPLMARVAKIEQQDAENEAWPASFDIR